MARKNATNKTTTTNKKKERKQKSSEKKQTLSQKKKNHCRKVPNAHFSHWRKKQRHHKKQSWKKKSTMARKNATSAEKGKNVLARKEQNTKKKAGWLVRLFCDRARTLEEKKRAGHWRTLGGGIFAISLKGGLGVLPPPFHIKRKKDISPCFLAQCLFFSPYDFTNKKSAVCRFFLCSGSELFQTYHIIK
jgi:hypothetical protein